MSKSLISPSIMPTIVMGADFAADELEALEEFDEESISDEDEESGNDN